MLNLAMRRCIAVAVLPLVIGLGGVVVHLESSTRVVAGAADPWVEEAGADGWEQEVVAVEMGGKPPEAKSPAVEVPSPDVEAGINVLSDVPAFNWSYGCSATCAAMLFGYYDRMGYGNMYSGPTNGGVCPLDSSIWGYTQYPSIRCYECPLSATHQGLDGRVVKGHVDDYWIDYGDAGPDPYVGNWTEHIHGDCTGDFMGTNQSKFSSTDGATTFYHNPSGDPLYDYTGSEPTRRDGCHGMRLFAESRGYSMETNYTQLILGQGSDPARGFTFSQYMAEIDAGRPVIIHVTGHTMLGYGYDTAGNKVYLRDTWDYGSHSMTWGSTYEGLQHKSVTVIRLASIVTMTIHTSGLISSNPATVYYSQGGETKTATTHGTWSDSVDWHTTVTIDGTVEVSSTERYGTVAVTSWMVTQTAICVVPYYHQFRPVVSALTAGPGHTDLDSANHAALTYYRYGSAELQSVFDGHDFNDWVDAGSTVSLSNPSSGSTSIHRWYCPGATLWTVNGAGSLFATYWDQFNPVISAVTAGDGHADLDDANCITLTYCQYGSAGTVSVFDAQQFSDWVDRGSVASLSDSSSGSTSNHRWYCPDTTSWTVNGAGSLSATYWDQFRPEVSVMTAGADHTDLDATNRVTLTYCRHGAIGTLSLFDGHGFNDWIDTGSTVGLSNPSSGSTETHRWYCLEATSWSVTDAGSHSAVYWDQLKPNISVVTAGNGHADLNGTNCATLTYTRCGVAGTAGVFERQSFKDWVDKGSTASLSSESTGSTATHRWYSPEATLWVIADTGSRSATYYEQYLHAIARIVGLDSSHPTTITFTRDGVTSSLTAFDSWTEWADVGSTVVVAKSVEGGWIGDWSTGDVTEWAVVSPASDPIRYQRSYAGLYALIGGLLAAAAVIGLAVFLLLRIRGRGYALRDLTDYFSDRLGQ